MIVKLKNWSIYFSNIFNKEKTNKYKYFISFFYKWKIHKLLVLYYI